MTLCWDYAILECAHSTPKSCFLLLMHIPRAQKKRNGGFSVPCELKVSFFFTSLDKAFSAEENDTKVIKFGWVILNLCTLLEIQSFSNFAWFLRPMSEELCRDKPSIWCLVEAHCAVFLLLPRINGLPQKTIWQVCPDTILRSSVAGRKNPAKFENDCISRNGHRIKFTQPNLMILVSFSSTENLMMYKKHNTFSSQGTENPPFRFFGTPGISSVESQKGVISFQRCSIENQKGAITACTKSMAMAPFWFSAEHLWPAIMSFWLSSDDILSYLSTTVLQKTRWHAYSSSTVNFVSRNLGWISLYFCIIHMWKEKLYTWVEETRLLHRTIYTWQTSFLA